MATYPNVNAANQYARDVVNDRVNTMYFDAGRVARTSTETRSRNIALNFLIRAK